jgi:hypothetical protein
MEKFILVSILSIVISINISAQVTQKKPIKVIKPITKTVNPIVKKVQTKAPPFYFNTNLTLLPANYNGLDIIAIYESLSSRSEVKTKGEYETTVDFNKRIDSICKAPIISKLTFDSIFCFQGDLDTYSDNLSYDADTEMFSILNRGLNSSTSGSIKNVNQKFGYEKISGIHSIGLKNVVENQGKYEASNAYGKTVTVEKTKFESYNIIEYNDNNFFMNGFSFKFKTSVDLARSYKQNGCLKLLFIGKIISPYTHQHFDSFKPTIDKPNEYINYDNYIYMNVQEIWLYDKISGIIYDKLKRTHSPLDFLNPLL